MNQSAVEATRAPEAGLASGLPFLRGSVPRAIFLCVLAGLVFFVPYHVRVAPSMSLSYLMDYNNRVAYWLFALGCLVYAVLTRGEVGAVSAEDQKLGLPSLFASMGAVLGGCWLNLYPSWSLPHGEEAQYALNRLQMLLSGKRPYVDFEYIYGAAHLYVPFGFSKLGLSPFAGFYLWWVLQWVAGTAMLWAAVEYLDFPMRHRRLVFWVLLVLQLHSLPSEGISYTPVRSMGSAFLILATHLVWRRWRRPSAAAACGIAATAGGMLISPELGVGVAAGLLGWFGWLAARKRNEFPVRAVALFGAGAGGVFLVCARAGVFVTLKDFAGGAYNYPLLPTLPVVLLLGAYLVAACVGVRELLRGNDESMAIPLAIGGFAMLPAAMGRCDMGHLQTAAPAFLLGVGAIETLPRIRVWWRPLALLTIVLPIGLVMTVKEMRHDLSRIRHSGEPTPVAQVDAGCAEIYRTPNVWPNPHGTAKQACLDTGYYAGGVDAITPAGIQRKIADLDRRPRQPILLFDLPLDKQMPPLEVDPAGLEGEGRTLFIPRVVHRPVTYAAIFEYIGKNYTADAQPLERYGTNYRVWRPKNP